MILHLVSGGRDVGVSSWGLDEICQEALKEYDINKKDAKCNLRVTFHMVLTVIKKGQILSSYSCWNGSSVSEEQRKWLQKQVKDYICSVKNKIK